MKNLLKQIGQILGEVDKNLDVLDREIDYIIKNEIRDIRRIESLLDIILDYVLWDKGKIQFEKLNNYYSTFREEFSADYRRVYHEILDLEE